MADEAQPDVEELVSRLQAYLDAHPKAADTLEGISRWWLGASATRISPDDVLQALQELQRRGVIEVHTVPGGAKVYAQIRPLRH